jgi:hypothetical protein
LGIRRESAERVDRHMPLSLPASAAIVTIIGSRVGCTCMGSALQQVSVASLPQCPSWSVVASVEETIEKLGEQAGPRHLATEVAALLERQVIWKPQPL